MVENSYNEIDDLTDDFINSISVNYVHAGDHWNTQDEIRLRFNTIESNENYYLTREEAKNFIELINYVLIRQR